MIVSWLAMAIVMMKQTTCSVALMVEIAATLALVNQNVQTANALLVTMEKTKLNCWMAMATSAIILTKFRELILIFFNIVLKTVFVPSLRLLRSIYFYCELFEIRYQITLYGRHFLVAVPIEMSVWILPPIQSITMFPSQNSRPILVLDALFYNYQSTFLRMYSMATWL